MAVSYKRLWIILAEKEMSRAELRKKAQIAPNTMTKLSKNEFVSMPILDKICEVLGTDYGEIMEHVPVERSDLK
jgi:DNA-binding Xre family transcriptional regulator